MEELFSAVLTGLLAFMAMDYTLGRATVKDPVRRATVKDPVRLAVSVVFAVLLVIVAGVLGLADIVSLD